jgi:tetratricopeptide (TPR) repeat protein
MAAAEGNGVRARRAVALASAPGAQSAMAEGAVVAELAEMAESVEMEAAASAPGAAGSGGATITVAAWNPDAPYLKAIAAAADGYAEYLVQKKTHGAAPAFYMDAAGFFFKKGETALGGRVLSNMAEFGLDDAKVWRAMGWRLREAGLLDAAIRCFRKALKLRGEEGQSRRDLALVLSEYGKANKDAAALAEAMVLLKEAAFTDFARRSGRRSNDRQVSIVALEELNALISWCEKSGVAAAAPEREAADRGDLPVRLRIVLSWDADETDIDLHVLEAEGEEAFYGHRRTDAGGFVGEDVTTGYGPEEYLRKEATGTFKILTNYFASHQTALTGPATVTATVYTDWATAAEKREVLTLRLDKPKEKLPIGDVSL